MMQLLKGFITKMSLAVVFLLLFSLRFVDLTIGEKITEYPLETAWKVTGLPLAEISTEAWLKLNNHWLNVYDLKIIAEEIKDKLGVTIKTKMTFGEQNEYNYVSFEGLRHDGTLVTVTLQSGSAGGTGETQLGVNTIQNGKVDSIRYYINSLKTVIAKVGVAPHFSVLLSGERSGKISTALARELAGKAFRKVEADVIASGFENGNSSQKGYTRLLSDQMTDERQPFNIEIATRYDETRNVTEIIIASPAVTDGI